VERILMVALGGAIGSAIRYVVSGLAFRWLGPDFPYGTMLVNLTGAFLIGIVQELATEPRVLGETARAFLAAGMLGGLTTYSAFSAETVQLMKHGAWTAAGLNVVLTTSACLLLCGLGMAVGRFALAGRG
jgi:CrcB protein